MILEMNSRYMYIVMIIMELITVVKKRVLAPRAEKFTRRITIVLRCYALWYKEYWILI